MTYVLFWYSHLFFRHIHRVDQEVSLVVVKIRAFSHQLIVSSIDLLMGSYRGPSSWWPRGLLGLIAGKAELAEEDRLLGFHEIRGHRAKPSGEDAPLQCRNLVELYA